MPRRWGGGKKDIDQRKAARTALTTILKNLAPYFEATAKKAGNPAMLDATGYDRQHSSAVHPNATGVPTGPADLRLKHGKLSGVIVATVKSVTGAGSYEAQLGTGDPAVAANWKPGTFSTGCSHIELTGLTPGQMYYVRVRAISGNGPGGWSDMASLISM